MIVRYLFIALMVFVAHRAFLKIKDGQFRINNLWSAPTVIERRERPLAYWGAATFFFAVIALMVGAAAFLPTS